MLIIQPLIVQNTQMAGHLTHSLVWNANWGPECQRCVILELVQQSVLPVLVQYPVQCAYPELGVKSSAGTGCRLWDSCAAGARVWVGNTRDPKHRWVIVWLDPSMGEKVGRCLLLQHSPSSPNKES